jgi:hypothetical protein
VAIAGNVTPKRSRITDAEYRRFVAQGVRRLAVKDGAARLGLDVGCGERTMRDARDEKSSLSGATLFNLLSVDPSALDELLAHFNLCTRELEPSHSSDAKLNADIAVLSASLAVALADGRIDHREEQDIASRARPVVVEIAGRIAAADRKRA